MIRIFTLIILTISLQITNATDLSLKLTPFPDIRYKDRIAATFTNNSKSPIRIIKPRDGSTRSLIYPHYSSLITDLKGNKLPMITGWCGLIWFWSDTKWPDDYIVELAPGKSFDMPFSIVHQIPKTGRYIIKLSYVFTPKNGEKVFNESYPEGLWHGAVSSNKLTAEFEKNTAEQDAAANP